MDSEEQTLRYYSLLFSLLFVIFYLFYFLFFQSFFQKDHILKIHKGDPIIKISNSLSKEENYLDKKMIYYTLKLSNKFYSSIKYGNFLIKKNINFIKIISLISSKSNIDYKITVIEGWNEYNLNKYLKNFFYKDYFIPYENVLAETYIINSSNSINDFKKHILEFKKNFFIKYKENKLLNQYGIKDILVISSLVEKEANNLNDKRLIASVIQNRLKKNMKLQIDATVIFSITEGKYKFNRKLNYQDLKLKHPYNTYIIKGLPPGMIGYSGVKTVEIVLENPKSDFLFYFYNILEKKHIFSKDYQEHKKKLNEYRKKTK